MKKVHFLSFLKKLFCVVSIIIKYEPSSALTAHIYPKTIIPSSYTPSTTGIVGGGGFEMTGGSFAANGWSIANGIVSGGIPQTEWSMATFSTNTLFSDNNFAFISNAGASSWTYTTSNSNVAIYSHLYRLVVIPPNEKIINLSFDWICKGEANTDGLQVSILPGTAAPQASDPNYPGTTGIQNGSVLGSSAILLTPGKSGFLNGKSSPQSFHTELPGYLAGTSFQLVFSWRNDNSTSTNLANNKPAAIDNVMLISDEIPTASNHSSDKTLFVEFFGTSIFNVDENNDQIFEREDALLEYALENGYQNLILKKIDDVWADPTCPICTTGNSIPLFSRAASNTTSTNLVMEGRLADFLHKAHSSPYHIRYIGAGSPPTQGENSPSTYNFFFDNINNFNYRQLNIPTYDATYCFDIIFTEADYWRNDPNANMTIEENYSQYFLYGLDYMHDIVQTASNGAGYHPLLVSTYIGDLKALKDYTTINIPIIDEQAQANMIESNVDWLFVDFYFDGNLLNHSPERVKYFAQGSDKVIKFFELDQTYGDRLLKFNATTNNLGSPSHNIKILPLFGGQSSGDPDRNYFGDYLKNKNGHVYDSNNELNWYGYPNNLDLLFNIYMDTYNPLNLATPTNSIKTQTPNNNYSEGFGWFKYGAMPDADHLLQIGEDPTNTPVVTTDKGIGTEEFVTVGGHACSNCNDINKAGASIINNLPDPYSASTTYRWYYYNEITGKEEPYASSSSSINVPVVAFKTDYYTCESEFYDSGHKGTFGQLIVRDEVKFTL